MKLTLKLGKIEKTVIKGEREERYSVSDAAIEVEFEAREIDTVLETCLDAFKAELREEKKVSMFPGHHSQGCCEDRNVTPDDALIFYIHRAENQDEQSLIKFQYGNNVYKIESSFSFETFGKIASNDDELTQTLALEKILDSTTVYHIDDVNVCARVLPRPTVKQLFFAIVREVKEHGFSTATEINIA